ncbi:hypothetical protein CDL12_22578 [Handroanthus impetiginosus]|uniref:CRM domain-containing protein n=1 Tax=Handroanthus impetiginosus TaxID=429701 RepID=A0A2G9GHY0_9LAMI|nr:hypothetical protein CDL12_22578 [Handroanthus impetiginosus]
MATLASSCPHQILHRFILRLPTPPFFHSVLSPQAIRSFSPLRTTPSLASFPFATRSHFSSSTPPRALSQQLADDLGLLKNVNIESERETDKIADVEVGLKSSTLGVAKAPPPPSLSVKEKKELASYAHSLGKKLKSQQVGKSGVTDTVVMALVETLEANELLKLKVHGTCPGELEDVVKQLEEATGSVAVGQIGRTVILYRPSLTKLKAEEKRKQAQRVYLKRQPMSRQSPQSKRPASASAPRQAPRPNGRGRRGSSRF